MNCALCHRTNLPGGVRCSYCGAPFEAAPEFDLSVGAGGAVGSPASVGAPESAGSKTNDNVKSGTGKKKGAMGGAAAAVGFLVLKGKALLSLPKLGGALVTLSTMILAIWAYQKFFGLPFSVGLVFLILIHELGHVAVNRRWGIKATAPMFLPFFGALILVKQFPANPLAESECGAGGPIGGLVASIICTIVWMATGSPLWMGLAYISFAINLFNLMPMWQLDGAHIGAVFTPANWYFVMIALLLWVIKIPSPLLWLVLVVALLFGIDSARRGRSQMAPPGVRARMVAVYLALCFSLGLGANLLHTSAGPYVQQLQSTGGSAAAASHGAGTSTAAVGKNASAAPRSLQNGLRIKRATAAQRADSAAQTIWKAIVLAAYHFWWVIWILCSLVWLLVTYLLSTAARQRYSLKSAAGALGMAAIYGLIYALSRVWSIAVPASAPLERVLTVRYNGLAHAGMIDLFLAYLAAETAALVFALSTLSRRRAAVRMSYSRLTWRCLSWMAGASLLVAYWTNNLWAFGLTLLGAAIFFAGRRWLVFSLAGQLRERLGDYEGSLALRHAALLRQPDAEGTIELWNRIAILNGTLGCAELTLEAMDAANEAGDTADATEYQLFSKQLIRAEALVALVRFDEALRICEAILQTPEGDRVGLWRPALVHGLLAKMAHYRGWYDEAVAQSDCVLKSRVPKNQAMIRPMVAAIYLSKAMAKAEMGECETALALCEKSSQLMRSPQLDSLAAITRAQIALRKGDATTAERESAEAMRLLSGSLQVRYWRGRALIAAGRREEGETMLRRLTEEYPRHHWAKLALLVVQPDSGLETAAQGLTT